MYNLRENWVVHPIPYAHPAPPCPTLIKIFILFEWLNSNEKILFTIVKIYLIDIINPES